MRMSIFLNNDEELKVQYLPPLICEICGLAFPVELHRRLRGKDSEHEHDSMAGQKE